MELVLATRNPHKVREFEGLLAPHRVLPLPDDVELPPETGDTFAENAMTAMPKPSRSSSDPSTSPRTAA